MKAPPKKYKTKKIKTFLFFLLVAVIFWVLTKFSKETIHKITATVAYTNTPALTLIEETNTDVISFDIVSNGFQQLSFAMKKPKIAIDISKYYEKGDTLLIISEAEMSRVISSQLNGVSLAQTNSVEEMAVQLEEIMNKIVPVRLSSNIQYIEGYRKKGPIQLVPDSVQIAGPSSVIDTIVEVNTEPLLLKNISERVEENLAIQLPNATELIVVPKSIVVAFEVSEFTQKQLSVPITLINAPSDLTLKLIPEEIDIKFNVAVQEFRSISAKDFRIVCDYANKSPEVNFMIPKLKEYPGDLHQIELVTKKVEYLIFK